MKRELTDLIDNKDPLLTSTRPAQDKPGPAQGRRYDASRGEYMDMDVEVEREREREVPEGYGCGWGE